MCHQDIKEVQPYIPGSLCLASRSVTVGDDMPVPAAAGLPRRVDVTAQDDHLYPISRASTCCQRSLPGAWARLVGNVVTVGNDTPAPAPALTARTWAAAARCSAALLGLEAVIGDCWLSLGACMPTVSDHILQNVVGLSAQDCESLDLHKIVTSISSHTHEAFGRSRTATWLYYTKFGVVLKLSKPKTYVNPSQ